MIRTTLTTAMLFLPLLMLQAAEHSTLDPNKLVAYYEFEATLLTIGHYATAEDRQMLADLNAGKPQSFPLEETSVNLYSVPVPLPEESRADALRLFIQHSRTVAPEYDFPCGYKDAQNAAERAKIIQNTAWFAARFLQVRAAQKANPIKVQVSEVKKYLQDVTHQSFDRTFINVNVRKIMAGLLVNEPGKVVTTLELLLLEAASAQ